ncbi:hypothetical protein P4C99_02255 [Pontiellaceae bacterium B1224]|nr:hypothetical protein [Pontiellaceae bacterium B1224]
MQECRWMVYMMCHNIIWDEMFEGDAEFSSEHYTFLKLGTHELEYNPEKGYRVIEESDFPVQWPDAHYAEFTGMYSLYKSGEHRKYDYIGFSQYDKEQRLIGTGPDMDIHELERARHQIETERAGGGPTNITELTEQVLADAAEPLHISYESHEFNKIYDQRVMMDNEHPDRFLGDGVNCMDRILEDYNAFFGTSFCMDDVAKTGWLNMCDSFLTPSETFDKLMSFIVPIMESRKLDKYDTKRKHRLQGGLLERYVAVFFALEDIRKVDLSTIHQYWKKKGPEKKTVFSRLKAVFVR